MEQNPQSQLKLLVQRGKEQGYLTYAEVNDHLPEDIVDSGCQRMSAHLRRETGSGGWFDCWRRICHSARGGRRRDGSGICVDHCDDNIAGTKKFT